LIQGTNTFNRLLQARLVIQANTSRIKDLSQDLVNLAKLQETSQNITPYQSNLVNEKRINLRNHIVNLEEGLRIHYHLAEEVLEPLISTVLLQTLAIKHREIVEKLSNVHMVILNLSPLGMLYNSSYLKGEIRAITLIIQDLSCQESSLLSFSGISRNEEPD